MTLDANQIGQEQRRRKQFAAWLTGAWTWAQDNQLWALANDIEELVSHAEEADYPLWQRAESLGVIGESQIADTLRHQLGLPVIGEKAVGWAREIGFSPLIALDEDVFDLVYNSMGWANRTVDPKTQGPNFWLWSPTGNMVRFIKKSKVMIDG